MKAELLFIIGCDTDPVSEPHDLKTDNGDIWERTVKTVENISDLRNAISGDRSGTPKITWFLRSDWQTYKLWNDWCYPGRTYRSIWDDLEKSNDEIGWHPHLWYLNKSSNTWYQSFDVPWTSYCLDEGYKEISKLFNIKSVRMGWDFHNNHTMEKLRQLNIKYDLSALPGMSNKYIYHNNYDWVDAPSYPYYPSKDNYKQERNCFNENELLEIPITVVSSPFYLSLFTKSKLIKFNLAKHPIFIKNLIKSIFEENNKSKLIASYFHPSDVNGDRGLFSSSNFKYNLNYLLKEAERKEVEIKFVTPNEIRFECMPLKIS